jgi:energy-coupling factor transport system permease protein
MDIAFGQYMPGRSVLHRLDPKNKIILMALYIAAIFTAVNIYALALVAASVLAIVLLSGVQFKLYIKSLKIVIVIVILTSLINLFYPSGEVIWQYGFLKLTLQGLLNTVFVAVRIVSLIFISTALTFTTSPNELTDAIERLMRPLKKIRVPVHEIAMMMTIALRFIPTLLEETEKIMKAQKARGADMETGNIFKRVKALVPVLIPLFVSAFRRAFDLATAMECRCYHGGEGRTKMFTRHMQKPDFIALAAFFVFLGAEIVLVVFL